MFNNFSRKRFFLLGIFVLAFFFSTTKTYAFFNAVSPIESFVSSFGNIYQTYIIKPGVAAIEKTNTVLTKTVTKTTAFSANVFSLWYDSYTSELAEVLFSTKPISPTTPAKITTPAKATPPPQGGEEKISSPPLVGVTSKTIYLPGLPGPVGPQGPAGPRGPAGGGF